MDLHFHLDITIRTRGFISFWRICAQQCAQIPVVAVCHRRKKCFEGFVKTTLSRVSVRNMTSEEVPASGAAQTAGPGEPADPGQASPGEPGGGTREDHYDGMSWRTRTDDPQASAAAEALDQVWLDRSLTRARQGLTSMAKWPKGLEDSLGAKRLDLRPAAA
jgi:hypothetical protein